MGAVQAAVASVALVLSGLLSGCSNEQLQAQQQARQQDHLQPLLVAKAEVVECPHGYDHHMGAILNEVGIDYDQLFTSCAEKCNHIETCLGFRFNSDGKECMPLRRSETSGKDITVISDTRGGNIDRTLGYQVCNKTSQVHRAPPTPAPSKAPRYHLPSKADGTEAPIYTESEVVYQEGAELQVGESVWLYAVGSSSLVWMTWVDQLHLDIARLGYKVPVVPANRTPEFFPRLVPHCDNSKYFSHLKTSRFGRIGWSSWDFALEGWEGCGPDGFRNIDGLRVKCQHGAGCAFSKNELKVSDIARDASRSNITLVATWFNDDQHWSTHFKCFDGEKKDWHQIAPITLHCLLRTVRAIHKWNPHTWIVVMAKYPQTYKHKTFGFVSQYNERVKRAMEKEPKTLFVEYYMPNDDEGEFYQSPAHGGHPNCRGSKIMAHAVLERLYKEKILSRSLKLLPMHKGHLLDSSCKEMTDPQCHTSALCWKDPETKRCQPFKPGDFKHRR